MLTVTGILVIIALATTLLAIANKCSLWVPVFCLVLVHLLSIFPR